MTSRGPQDMVIPLYSLATDLSDGDSETVEP